MKLLGGYRIPYDAKPALERLVSDRKVALSELWENLYHQGDVGTASYSAVPMLVHHGELSLVAAIEVARHSGRNEEIPESLLQEYSSALEQAIKTVPVDEDQLLAYYSIHASLHGHLNVASALNNYTINELIEGI